MPLGKHWVVEPETGGREHFDTAQVMKEYLDAVLALGVAANVSEYAPGFCFECDDGPRVKPVRKRPPQSGASLF